MTAPDMLDIDIIVRDPQWESTVLDITETCRLSACAAFTAGVSRPMTAEAALVLADDEFVASLNQQYRNREGATNVLSFAAMDGDEPDAAVAEGAPLMLGDIIVARETTVREAEESGISTEHHLRHLVVHGMLHLLGFDHTTEEEAEEMEPLETRVLAEMGIADPYGGDSPSAVEARP